MKPIKDQFSFLSFILLSFVVLICRYNLAYFYSFHVHLWLIFFSLPLSFIWFISCLAETNRTPFDFAEGGGGSELVSAFNVECGGGGFALIFLAEYASILFISLLFCIIFLGSNLYSFLFYVRFTFVSFLFVWVRGTMPRFRYDKLMYLAWKRFLPLSLNYLLFFVGVRCFVFSLL
jgi:NADH-ubiquinone oxidoreductase chain 1